MKLNTVETNPQGKTSERLVWEDSSCIITKQYFSKGTPLYFIRKKHPKTLTDMVLRTTKVFSEAFRIFCSPRRRKVNE